MRTARVMLSILLGWGMSVVLRLGSSDRWVVAVERRHGTGEAARGHRNGKTKEQMRRRDTGMKGWGDAFHTDHVFHKRLPPHALWGQWVVE